MSSYQYRKAHWTSYADPAKRRGRSGRPHRRWRAKVLEGAQLACCRCGGPVDKTLPWRHPLAATADHYPIPLVHLTPAQVLDPAYGRPAHRRCNLSAGARVDGPVRARVADRRW